MKAEVEFRNGAVEEQQLRETIAPSSILSCCEGRRGRRGRRGPGGVGDGLDARRERGVVDHDAFPARVSPEPSLGDAPPAFGAGRGRSRDPAPD